MSDWRALRAGESVRERRALLELAHERFMTEGIGGPAALAPLAQVRPVVLASWLRSRQRTIDPDHAPQRPALSAADLTETLLTQPIGRVLPVVQRLLLEEATESGFVVAVGDAAGRLLWLDGDHGLRARAEDIGFAAGVDWSEDAVGTSAPGSAIALNHAIQVLGAEHYARAVHEWSCTAAPVHDPDTGAILGVIDVTGGDGAASPHLMPLVEATVAAVHAELKLASLRARIEAERHTPAMHIALRAPAEERAYTQPPRSTQPRGEPLPESLPEPRLVALGRDPALFEYAGATYPVSGRHGEILLALATAPRGLNSAQLTQAVYGEAGSAQTLRAEIVRLRRWLVAIGVPLQLESRPYQLSGVLRVDAVEALEALARGAHRLALAAYEGPLMPASEAPVVVELRREGEATLREALLQSATADLLFEYAQNWALGDTEVWHTLLQVLPAQSPKRARVVAQLGELDALN